MKSLKLTMQLILVRTIKMKIRSTSIGMMYVSGTQFANELNNSYENIVHWKRNLFMLPSGGAGTKWWCWKK